MATSLLDPRDTCARPPAGPLAPAGAVEMAMAAVPAVPAVPAAPRRRPVAVVVLGGAGVLQAVALVAIALTCLTGMLAAEHRAPDVVIVAVLVGLAGWTVLSASAGAAVLEGSGRGVLVGVAVGEVVVVSALLVVAATTSLLDGVTGGLPGPALALLALAIPLGRLLLATAASTVAWVEAGPVLRERPDDLVHRRLCAVTLAVIGVALGAVALLGPTAAPAAGPAPASSTGR